jgi:hypothetical protein
MVGAPERLGKAPQRRQRGPLRRVPLGVAAADLLREVAVGAVLREGLGRVVRGLGDPLRAQSCTYRIVAQKRRNVCGPSG